MSVNKIAARNAALSRISLNVVIFTFSIIGTAIFFVCVPIMVENGGVYYFCFGLLICPIYLIGAFVDAIVIYRKICANLIISVTVYQPTVSEIKRYLKGDVRNRSLIALKITGKVNGKKRSFYEFNTQSLRNDVFSKRAQALNKFDTIDIQIFKGTNILTTYITEESEKPSIKKLKEPVVFTDIITHNVKTAKYEPIKYHIDKIKKLLNESATIEQLFVCNDQNMSAEIVMYPEADGDARGFMLSGKEYESVAEMISVLDELGFIDNNSLSVFETVDGNAPLL